MEKRINIEAERARYQLTKEQLCHKLGITGKTYLSYIRGGSMPLEKAVQLARMFGCSLDYIAGLTETRQPLNPQQPGDQTITVEKQYIGQKKEVQTWRP